MTTFPVYLVFFFGGLIFANFVLTPIFLILSLAVTSIYFVYNFAVDSQLGGAVVSAIIGFVLIQLGYVGGVGLRTAYANFFPGRNLRSDYQDLGKEKTKIE